MQKIISLFQRNYDGDRLVRNEVTPGAEWVGAGEGVATRKWDGTCCLIRGGKLYKRFEVKPGGTPPENFEPACDVDPNTGKQQGWLPVGDGPEDRWHREAWESHQDMLRLMAATGMTVRDFEGVTVELMGPRINGNPEGWEEHTIISHGSEQLDNCPRDFEGLKAYLSQPLDAVTPSIEGVVWHHPDGRMVKIKGKDFGIKRDKCGKGIPTDALDTFTGLSLPSDPGIRYDWPYVERAVEMHAGLVAMLKELEWSQGEIEIDPVRSDCGSWRSKCPVCWNDSRGGHSPACKLAPLLKKAEG